MSKLNMVISQFKAIRKNSAFEKKLIAISEHDPKILNSVSSFLDKQDRPNAIKLVNQKARLIENGPENALNAQEDEDNSNRGITSIGNIL